MAGARVTRDIRQISLILAGSCRWHVLVDDGRMVEGVAPHLLAQQVGNCRQHDSVESFLRRWVVVHRDAG